MKRHDRLVSTPDRLWPGQTTVTSGDTSAIEVLATQPIDMSKPQPFTEAGNRELNSFVWMPPANSVTGRFSSPIPRCSAPCLELTIA